VDRRNRGEVRFFVDRVPPGIEDHMILADGETPVRLKLSISSGLAVARGLRGFESHRGTLYHSVRSLGRSGGASRLGLISILAASNAQHHPYKLTWGELRDAEPELTNQLERIDQQLDSGNFSGSI
jgi:hypothetical protein